MSDSRHTPQERDRFEEFEREFENIAGAIRLAARVNRPAARELIAFLWAPCVRRGHIYDLVGWIETNTCCRTSLAVARMSWHCSSLPVRVYRAAGVTPRPALRRDGACEHTSARCRCRGDTSFSGLRLPDPERRWTTGTVHAHEAFAAALAARDERGRAGHAGILLTTLEHRAGHYPEARTHGTVARDICIRRHIDMPIRLIGISH